MRLGSPDPFRSCSSLHCEDVDLSAVPSVLESDDARDPGKTPYDPSAAGLGIADGLLSRIPLVFRRHRLPRATPVILENDSMLLRNALAAEKEDQERDSKMEGRVE